VPSVGPADYTSSSSSSAIINAAVDVTNMFAGLAGGAHPITLANLAGTQGPACTAGWALHVAYDYGQFIPGNPDSQARKVYTAFGNTTVAPLTNRTVTFSGFRTTTDGATFAIMVADGDPTDGDSMAAEWPGGSETLANPLGETSNAFHSLADGASSYVAGVADTDFRNGSVDVYETTSATCPRGPRVSTSGSFRRTGTGSSRRLCRWRSRSPGCW
jgi:hypothetical protein